MSVLYEACMGYIQKSLFFQICFKSYLKECHRERSETIFKRKSKMTPPPIAPTELSKASPDFCFVDLIHDFDGFVQLSKRSPEFRPCYAFSRFSFIGVPSHLPLADTAPPPIAILHVASIWLIAPFARFK